MRAAALMTIRGLPVMELLPVFRGKSEGETKLMGKITREYLLAGGALAALIVAGAAWTASAQTGTPDLMQGGMGWNSAGGMEAVAGSPSPVVQDPKVKYVPNNVGGQPTWRYADVTNPNLTDFAKDGLRKANQMVDQ